MRARRSGSARGYVPGIIALLLATSAAPVSAQVPCVRHEMAFSCADGTTIAIVDDPARMGGFRGHRGSHEGGLGFEPGRGEWLKDDQYITGPDGQRCLLHGTHVHCGSFRED